MFNHVFREATTCPNTQLERKDPSIQIKRVEKRSSLDDAPNQVGYPHFTIENHGSCHINQNKSSQSTSLKRINPHYISH